MLGSPISFIKFPEAETTLPFIRRVVNVFEKNREIIGTRDAEASLSDNKVLEIIRADLVELGFVVAAKNRRLYKDERTTFLGYITLAEIDAYHIGWRCGLELGSSALMPSQIGNCIYHETKHTLETVPVDVRIFAMPRSTQRRRFTYPLKIIYYRSGQFYTEEPKNVILIEY